MSSHPTAFRPFGSKFGSKYFSIRLKLVALIQESIDQVVLNDDREQSFDEFGLGGGPRAARTIASWTSRARR
ncbi:MAG TPA: hypothetical protein VMS82_19460, partial [Pseudolabrys sp.]|nr:hypothetical protein [Pseudolabrys sp.]